MILLVLFLAPAVVFPVSAEENRGKDSPGTIFEFYRTVVSPADGERCGMHPTCSAYMEQAVKKHGAVVGWIMGLDRLVRCGRDEEHLSPLVRVNDRLRVSDPVENNDFWWSRK